MVQAIADVTHQEYDSSNSSAVRLCVYSNECAIKLRQWVKQVNGARGLWHVDYNPKFQRLLS